MNREREGTMGCLLHKYPKFYNTVFFFVGLTTLGNIEDLDLLVLKLEHSNVSTTNFNIQKGWFCVSSLGVYINLSAIVLSL